MGKNWSKLVKSNKEVRVLMVGLDGAGKTSLLYKFSLGKPIVTVPTIGFNSEEVKFGNIQFSLWDVGGQDKIRGLWRHYYSGTEGIIFVVDAADKDRIDEARHELFRILNEKEMKTIKLLILANKIDLPHALSREKLVEALDLKNIPEKHEWHFECTCATSEKMDSGLENGFEWLASHLRPKKVKKGEKKTRKDGETGDKSQNHGVEKKSVSQDSSSEESSS
jgi:small GTP-binding protein